MRRWAIAAAVLGTAYALLTPPFEVPDEVFHFWRPLVIANGQLLPQRRGEADAGTIPLGAQNLVYVMSQKGADGRYTREQMRVAWQSPPELHRPKLVRFPAWYTPVPYAPQTLAAIAMRVFDLRPLLVFYLGRLLNLAAALALLALAMRAAPELANVIAAVTLLPATLAQMGSWSPDALTIALATLLTAMLFRDRARPSIVIAFALALCKPAYFLIALLRRKWPVIAASAAGTAIALGYARLGGYNQRLNDPVDAGAQIRCLLGDPLRFVRAVAHDVPAHGWLYVEQMIGRFGAVSQVRLPVVITVTLLVLTVGTGFILSRGRLKPAPTVGILVLSVLGIFLSQFLIWSVACGEVVEGVQGRYFLPLLPLALTTLAIPRLRSIPPAAIVAAALLFNAVALWRIVRAFW
jgi:uncharacterized membrane protein